MVLMCVIFLQSIFHLIIGPRKYDGLVEDKKLRKYSPPFSDDYDSNDKQQYLDDLGNKNDLIKRSFVKLVSSTFRSLKERRVDFSSIKIFFQQFISTIENNDSYKLLAENLLELHAEVGKYFSFCTFDMIADLIDDYGSRKDKRKLKEYKEAFKKFIILLHNNRVKFSHVHGKDKIVIKLDLDLEDNQLPFKKVQRIQAKVSSILRVPTCALALQEVRHGCFELVFSVPKFVCQRVLQLERQYRVEMFQESIASIETCCSPHQVQLRMNITCFVGLAKMRYIHISLVT